MPVTPRLLASSACVGALVLWSTSALASYGQFRFDFTGQAFFAVLGMLLAGLVLSHMALALKLFRFDSLIATFSFFVGVGAVFLGKHWADARSHVRLPDDSYWTLVVAAAVALLALMLAAPWLQWHGLRQSGETPEAVWWLVALPYAIGVLGLLAALR